MWYVARRIVPKAPSSQGLHEFSKGRANQRDEFPPQRQKKIRWRAHYVAAQFSPARSYASIRVKSPWLSPPRTYRGVVPSSIFIRLKPFVGYRGGETAPRGRPPQISTVTDFYAHIWEDFSHGHRQCACDGFVLHMYVEECVLTVEGLQ